MITADFPCSTDDFQEAFINYLFHSSTQPITETISTKRPEKTPVLLFSTNKQNWTDGGMDGWMDEWMLNAIFAFPIPFFTKLCM